MTPIVPTGEQMTTRRLRMWHWDTAVYARSIAEKYCNQTEHAKADFHIKAVQALNDCPDCIATTAEQDLEAFYNGTYR